MMNEPDRKEGTNDYFTRKPQQEIHEPSYPQHQYIWCARANYIDELLRDNFIAINLILARLDKSYPPEGKACSRLYKCSSNIQNQLSSASTTQKDPGSKPIETRFIHQNSDFIRQFRQPKIAYGIFSRYKT